MNTFSLSTSSVFEFKELFDSCKFFSRLSNFRAMISSVSLKLLFIWSIFPFIYIHFSWVSFNLSFHSNSFYLFSTDSFLLVSLRHWSAYLISSLTSFSAKRSTYNYPILFSKSSCIYAIFLSFILSVFSYSRCLLSWATLSALSVSFYLSQESWLISNYSFKLLISNYILLKLSSVSRLFSS